MGLDWMLQRKIKQGCEEEATRLMGTPRNQLPVDEAERIEARLDEISMSPYEAMGCPRIGIDSEATEYMRSLYGEHPDKFYVVVAREPEGTTEKRSMLWGEVLKEYHGQYVPELAKEPDGMGHVTGVAAPLASYRGKMVSYLSILPDSERDRAFTDMTAKQMLSYADDLESRAREAIGQAVDPADREKMLAALEGKSQDLTADHLRDYHVIHTACRWLRFWGGKGFDMWAWY